MTDPSDFPAVGELFLGRYRIHSMLGSGGFARVYRAVQEDLDREVAIKVMRPAVDPNAEDTAETRAQIQLVEKRFRREARVISKFRSPYTVVVHDYGRTDGGLLFMTLEYVDGQTVGDLIYDFAPMRRERVVPIVSQVLESLHEAHAFDILHRDIKPQNVMVFDHLEQRDLVKVLDFGIAKVLEVEEDPAGTNELTTDGVLVGTPRYMSPEQIRGDALTPSSDIYSLGLVMYEMLFGRKAIDEPTTMRIIARHLDPTPLELPHDHDIGDSLRALLGRMLAKEPSERFQSARDTLQALQAWDPLNDDAETARVGISESSIPTAVLTDDDDVLDTIANAVTEASTAPMDALDGEYEVPATTVIAQPSFPEDRPAGERPTVVDPLEDERPTKPISALPAASSDADPRGRERRPTPRLDERLLQGQEVVEPADDGRADPEPSGGEAVPAAIESGPVDATTEEMPQSHARRAEGYGREPTAQNESVTIEEPSRSRLVYMLPLLGLVVLLIGISAVAFLGGDEETAPEPSGTTATQLVGSTAEPAENSDEELAEPEGKVDELADPPDGDGELAAQDAPTKEGAEDPAELEIDADEDDQNRAAQEHVAKVTGSGSGDEDGTSDDARSEKRVTNEQQPAKKVEKKPKRRFFSVE